MELKQVEGRAVEVMPPSYAGTGALSSASGRDLRPSAVLPGM